MRDMVASHGLALRGVAMATIARRGVDSLSDHEERKPGAQPTEAARWWLFAIADSTDDAIVGKDLAGVITSWNRGATVMFGYTADEVVGSPITIIIPPERHEEEVSILARINRGERIVHFASERQRKDGTIVPVSLTISPIRDDSGRIVGISKIARDLSELNSAHQDALRREALMNAILRNVPDALIVINSTGQIK